MMKTNRILSLTLVFAMLLSMVSMVLPAPIAVATETDPYLELTLDTPADATITESDQIAYFSFTPTEDGAYIFRSMSDDDTRGYLYDSDMNQLSSNDDGGINNNFLLSYIHHHLQGWHPIAE